MILKDKSVLLQMGIIHVILCMINIKVDKVVKVYT